MCNEFDIVEFVELHGVGVLDIVTYGAQLEAPWRSTRYSLAIHKKVGHAESRALCGCRDSAPSTQKGEYAGGVTPLSRR